MERKQIIYKYSQLKIFHSDDQLQVYMYAFMYVDPETFSVEDHFPAKKVFFLNNTKMATPGIVQKIGLGLVTYVKKIMS